MLWVCQWFSLGTPGSNKTGRHDITEILLKVVLNTIKPTNQPSSERCFGIDKLLFHYVYYLSL
jgi:hypothetical protein